MANIGYGTLLQHSTDGASYTTIAKLDSIGAISIGDADDIDTTNHDSANGHREFIRGLVDAGEIPFAGNWEAAASQQTVVTRLQTGPTSTLDYLKVVFPNSLGTWIARGYFKSMEIDPQFDDKIQFSGVYKVSGKPTFSVP